jgi:hypothetical protein
MPTAEKRFANPAGIGDALLPGAGPVASVDVLHGGTVSEAAAEVRRGIVRILLFFTMTLVILVGTHALIGGGLRRIRTSDFGVFNRMVDGDINASIVVSGSSRALNHFDPRVIQRTTGLSAFNIGVNGSQTDMQLAVLKTYLTHNTRPSLVVLSLDSFTFVTSHGGVYFPGQYLPYLKQDDLYHALREINPSFWKSKYLPLYGYAVEDMNFTWLKGLGGLLGLNPVENRYLGFEPRDTVWTGDFERLRESNPGGVRFTIEPDGVRDFEGMITFCEQRGIPVLLVYSPVYHEMQALEANRDEVFGRFREIAGRHGVPLWDYSASPISLRKEYFYNSQHLNAGGAAAFSDEFAAALARAPFVAR